MADKGWYRINLYANPEHMEYYGTPTIPTDYQTPPTTLKDRIVLEALQQLDAEEQQLVHLRFFERLSLREIARELNHTSHGVTQHQLRKVIQKMRTHYDNILRVFVEQEEEANGW